MVVALIQGFHAVFLMSGALGIVDVVIAVTVTVTP